MISAILAGTDNQIRNPTSCFLRSNDVKLLLEVSFLHHTRPLYFLALEIFSLNRGLFNR